MGARTEEKIKTKITFTPGGSDRCAMPGRLADLHDDVRKMVAELDRRDLIIQKNPTSITGYTNVIKVGKKFQARLQVPGDGRGGTRKRAQYSLPTTFDTASLTSIADMAASKEDVLARVAAIESGDDSVVLLDSLPTSSYEGTGPTTAGRRAGHITGAVSLPYSTLFSPDTGLFKQEAELRQAFADVGITQGVPILAY